MGMTTDDIFGARPGVERAAPGSYGVPPRGHRLPADVRVGRVRLQVSDLERSLAFYADVLGLRLVARSTERAEFAAQGDDRVLVELVHGPNVRPGGRGARLGLYHFAILVPDRASLGRFVQHLGALGVRAGAGDHLVSEAFYLHDPDGLGIEVYADRPREAWRRIRRELQMATDPVDVHDLLRATGDTHWEGMPAGTVIGHVHLHVGDIAEAAAFYADGVGFDRMTWSYPGALFLAAGGYHHHLGTNTWAGPGAVPAAPDQARLLEWTIELPDTGAVSAVAANLESAGYRPEPVGEEGFVVADPWGTRLRVRPAR